MPKSPTPVRSPATLLLTHSRERLRQEEVAAARGEAAHPLPDGGECSPAPFTEAD